MTHDIGHAPQGVVVMCRAKNIAGDFNATLELKFDSKFMLQSCMQASCIGDVGCRDREIYTWST